MNLMSKNFEFVSNPDRTIRKSDGKLSNSNWDTAAETIAEMINSGIPQEYAFDSMAKIYVEGAPKIFAVSNSVTGRDLRFKTVRYKNNVICEDQRESGSYVTIPAGTVGTVAVDENDTIVIVYANKPQGFNRNFVTHVNLKRDRPNDINTLLDNLEILD